MPRVGTRSLWATGRPNSGPAASPRASAASFARASSSARSAVSVTMAFTLGLTRAIWARCAWTTSVTETSRTRTFRASSVAVRKQRSVLTRILRLARALKIFCHGPARRVRCSVAARRRTGPRDSRPDRSRVEPRDDIVAELLRLLFGVWRPARNVKPVGFLVVSKRQLRCHSISPAARLRPRAGRAGGQCTIAKTAWRSQRERFVGRYLDPQRPPTPLVATLDASCSQCLETDTLTAMNETRTLARFAAQTKFTDLPRSLVDNLKITVLDTDRKSVV